MLASYLKGENSGPEEAINQISFRVDGIYLLMAEPKGKDDENNKQFSFYDERRYLIDDFRPDQETERYFQKLEDEKDAEWEESNKTTDKWKGNGVLDEGDQDNSPSFHSFGDVNSNTSDNLSIGMEDIPVPDGKFIYGGNDSFDEHLGDIKDTSKGKFGPEEKSETSAESGPIKDVAAEKRKLANWWDQRLLLLIEILGVQGGFVSYRNGKVMTIEDHPFRIKSMMISTAMTLYDATQERRFHVEADGIDKPSKDKMSPEYTPYDRISFLNYKDLLMDLLSYDFYDLGQEINPLISFLEENSCGNLAAFLLTYLR